METAPFCRMRRGLFYLNIADSADLEASGTRIGGLRIRSGLRLYAVIGFSLFRSNG